VQQIKFSLQLILMEQAHAVWYEENARSL